MCEHCEKAIKFQGTSEEDELYIIRNHLNYSPAKGSGFCVLIGYCPECGRELRRGEPADKITIDINGNKEDISAMLIGAERYEGAI